MPDEIDDDASRPELDWVDVERTRHAVLERVFGKSSPPLRLDRFVVLQTLGQGAMGRVYLVYDPELDRNVALKLIRSDAAVGDGHAEQRRGRLQREARAIAKLTHPNVVAVHEIGTVERNGVTEVFILMEYVDGSTLRAWCQEPERTGSEMLDAYLQAGEGLAAAHAAGIVHRDFKPDNAVWGTDGRVRVVDFGLAAGATESEVFEAPREGNADLLLTRTDAVLGTPAYMAPEQLQGARADACSDQFSFCVSLYEALYGERPFQGKDPLQLLAAMGEPPAATTSRRPAPAHVQSALMRGLSPQPSDRHPSMGALLEALRRDPRPKRRRIVLAVGATVSAVALGSLATATRVTAACAPPTGRLAGVWDDAAREAVASAFEATGVGFARDTYERVKTRFDARAQAWLDVAVASCEAARNDPPPLALERARCVDRDLRRLAALSRELQVADPEVAERAIEALDALADPRACLDANALAQDLVAPDPADVDRVATLRDEIEDATVRASLGHYAPALTAMRATVEGADATDYLPVMAEARLALGMIESSAGEDRAAESTLERAYWLARRTGHERVQLDAASRLVFVVGFQLGRVTDGEAWARGAEADWERSSGDPLVRARLDSNLGAALNLAGRYDAALERHRAALAVRERSPGHVLGRAASHTNLGITYLDTGNAEEARKHIELGLRLNETELGPLHPSVANSHHNLSRAFQAQGEDAAARVHLQRALDIWGDALGEDNPTYAVALNTLGAFDSAIGEYERARPNLERAAEILGRAQGLDSPARGSALYNLAFVDHVAGRLDEANTRYAEVLAIFEARFGADRPLLAGVVAYYATALLEAGDVTRGAPLVERAATLCAADGAAPSDCAQARFAEAMLALARGDRALAKAKAQAAEEAFAPLSDPRALERIEAWRRDHLATED
ncbi:MAG: serine/threonine-protein kinase [Myxococcota bacterium]